MSKLAKEQIRELEHLWRNETLAVSKVVSPDVLEDIGRRFPPSDRGHEPGLAQAVEDAAEARVMRYSDPIRQRLCIEWDYCEKRSAFRGEGFQLTLAVADALLAFVTLIPIPVTSLSVYLVRRGVLDKICQCQEQRA
ncbi:MAG: hypothetical protein WAM70_16540 [Pyrinomonadaceae bacterium]